MTDIGSLFEIIQRLDEFEDDDRSSPLVIHAQNGANARRQSPVRVCRRGEGRGLTCPLGPLPDRGVQRRAGARGHRGMVRVARELVPSPKNRFRTVIFCAQNGASFPLESDQEGM